MKRVCLYAYDKVNLGDDLFIRTIAARYPDTKFYLWSDSANKRNFSDVDNLNVIDQQSRIMRFLGKIRGSIPSRFRTWLETHCDAIVYIGGSIFMEYPNWERYVDWWKGKACQNRMFVLGANWGPYQTPEYKDGMADTFGYMKDVCFRDQYSKNQFAGVPNVRYAPDILLSLPMPEQEIQKKQIFVSLIDCNGDDHAELRPYQQSYLDHISNLLRQYLADGWQVVLSSFCRHEGDEKAVSEVLCRLGDDFEEKIRMLAYDGTNSQMILQTIAESDYCFATRFHGVILALASGRPVLPIIYSDKTRNTLESIGFEGRYLDLRTQEQISYEVSKENWVKQIKIDRDNICPEAENHFSELDKVLK